MIEFFFTLFLIICGLALGNVVLDAFTGKEDSDHDYM